MNVKTVRSEKTTHVALLIVFLAVAVLFVPVGTVLAGAASLLVGAYLRRQERPGRQALLFITVGCVTLLVGLAVLFSGFTTSTGGESDSPRSPRVEPTQAP
ncbi:hypothetical protein ACX6XY_25560 [Streptomyces sp. O3]